MTREKDNNKGKDEHSLIKNLPIGTSIMDKSMLDTLLNPPTHEWRKMGDIKPGDKVSWWTQDAKVISVRIEGNTAFLKVIDPSDGKEKEFTYKANDELNVRKVRNKA